MKNSWPMREARTQFSRVVRTALANGPQTLTRRGKPVVLVMSVEEFRQSSQSRKAPSLTNS